LNFLKFYLLVLVSAKRDYSKWIQWNSRTFLAYRIDSNRIKHGFAGSELFQYFDVFSIESKNSILTCIWMILHDVFEWSSIEILKKFDSVRSKKFGWFRFASIFLESSRVSLELILKLYSLRDFFQISSFKYYNLILMKFHLK